MTPPERDQVPREKGVAAWERPTLTLLGDVKDLIHVTEQGERGSLPRGHALLPRHLIAFGWSHAAAS